MVIINWCVAGLIGLQSCLLSGLEFIFRIPETNGHVLHTLTNSMLCCILGALANLLIPACFQFLHPVQSLHVCKLLRLLLLGVILQAALPSVGLAQRSFFICLAICLILGDISPFHCFFLSFFFVLTAVAVAVAVRVS